MQRACIGFRVHSGWAVVVTVAGSIASPSVVDRRRIQLVDMFIYKFRQPYHTAQQMPLKEAAEFIKRVETEARDLARSGIDALQRQLTRVGHDLVGCGLLLSSGRQLPVFMLSNFPGGRSHGAIDRAFAAGALAWLEKVNTTPTLLATKLTEAIGPPTREGELERGGQRGDQGRYPDDHGGKG